MGLPYDDQETTITFRRMEKSAVIWTSDSTIMNKLDKLAEKSNHYKATGVGRIGGRIVDKTYELDDKSLLSFRADKIKRDLTEEQRAIMAERFKQTMGFNASQGADDGQ